MHLTGTTADTAPSQWKNAPPKNSEPQLRSLDQGSPNPTYSAANASGNRR
jgi:hypothetical protein